MGEPDLEPGREPDPPFGKKKLHDVNMNIPLTDIVCVCHMHLC